MTQNPKYDNDFVTLAYLKSKLNEEVNKNDENLKKLPKTYGSPPVPPYYKGSLLTYEGNLYCCKKERLMGVFSFNDWEIVATDNTSLDNFIENTYSVDKLQIQQQMDNKVETHYQDSDPSLEWTDDLLKSKHIGDYWYNTQNNTQWRYNKISTNPITYAWGQVNVPMSVYDLINSKKSIYTSKPPSYKKDDLWVIEDNISQSDIPIGTNENSIGVGTWVVALQDSDVYNKTHWEKRDNNINIEYIEDHYYTKEYIDENHYTQSEVDSKITQSKSDIRLEVEQNYTKIDEFNSVINDYDTQIDTLNETITTQGTNISNLTIETGAIRSTVASHTEQFNTIENSVIQLQTDTYTKTQIDTKLKDGSVEKVSTTSTTFDETGMSYEKSDAKTDIKVGFEDGKEGLSIKDKTSGSNEELLFSGYDSEIGETIVRSKNIKVEKYLTIGTHSRIEDYEDGTGIFYLG